VEIDGGPWCKIPEGKTRRGHRHQGQYRGHRVATGAHAPDDFGRHRHAEFERRLLSDALAAQVGGIGIAPGGNINTSPARIFEATPAPRRNTRNKDVVNPGSSC